MFTIQKISVIGRADPPGQMDMYLRMVDELKRAFG
jgi:hypothetical protein